MAALSLIDGDRHWVKSCVGLRDREVPPALAASADASDGGQFVAEDAPADGSGVRFYAGQVLETALGHKLGTLCVAAPEPRAFTDEDRATLSDLAGWAEQELSSTELGEALRERAETEVRLRSVMDTVADGVVSFGADGIIESANPAAE